MSPRKKKTNHSNEEHEESLTEFLGGEGAESDFSDAPHSELGLFGEIIEGSGSTTEDEAVEQAPEAVLPLDKSVQPRAQQEPYVVLARRYRPQTFQDIVGQEHVRDALCAAISRGEIGHAYLFSGPRGTGKTSTARILAKALNCQENGPRPDPCGKCASCRAITAGSSLDVIEIDAASNTGVDNIRDLRTGVVLAPFSRYKVYIVDEVHMLSMQAFNALLKTLEEPPPHVVFVLATTELHKVPETIVSRCQCFHFRRFTVSEIVRQLDRILEHELSRRQLSVAPGERQAILELIARNSEGGMRDAQVALDQILVLSKSEITLAAVQRFLGMANVSALDEFVRALGERRTEDLLLIVDELVQSGFDLERFVRDVAHYLRDLLILRAAPSREELIGAAPDRLMAMRQLSETLPMTFLFNLSRAFATLADQMKQMLHARFALEFEIIRLTKLDPVDDLKRLIDRLDGVTGKVSSPAHETRGRTFTSGGERSVVMPPTPCPTEKVDISGDAQRPNDKKVIEPAVASSGASGVTPERENLPHTPRTVETATTPISSPASAPASSSPGQLSGTEFYQKLVALVANENEALSRSLREAALVKLSEQAVVLAVNPANRFVYDHLNRGPNFKKICAAIEQLLGRPIPLRIEFSDLGDGGGAATEAIRPTQDAPNTSTPEQGAPPEKKHSVAGVVDPKSFGALEEAEDTDESLEAEPPIVDRERILESFREPLRGKALESYLERNGQAKKVVEEIRELFNVPDSNFGFKPNVT